ncbi:hypothetical protein ACJJTC_015190 [Scirpophaga incertulas]
MPPLPQPKPGFAMKHSPKPTSEVPVQSIVVGKPTHGGPSQATTLKLGQSDIIMNQVVRSQITLPGVGDAISQPNNPTTYLTKPGQIILGKPMDNPKPLDQHITINKHHTLITPHIVTPEPHKHITKGHMSVESGFKPIIREPLMAAEDRITNDDSSSNRREDTDVEEDYEEAPQYINHSNPSDKLTQSFEPMFIPSPPDHLIPSEDRTREVFPSNHAKEDRPHPVYVKTEAELNTLFSKMNMEKDVPSDMMMESNKVSPQYLPPDPKLPKEHSQRISSNPQTFTTYDGKIVSADTLTTVPETPKPNTKIVLFKTSRKHRTIIKISTIRPF